MANIDRETLRGLLAPLTTSLQFNSSKKGGTKEMDYKKIINELWENGQMPIGLNHVQMIHDYDCRISEDTPCTCEPEIKAATYKDLTQFTNGSRGSYSR